MTTTEYCAITIAICHFDCSAINRIALISNIGVIAMIDGVKAAWTLVDKLPVHLLHQPIINEVATCCDHGFAVLPNAQDD
jgi:hypothetical protein